MKKIFLIFIILIGLNFSLNVSAKEKKINMGQFKLTAYCPCEECSEGWGRRTAAQTSAQSEYTIAVDPDIIDLGSKVKIGNKIYKAEDTGGAVEGDHIDIFFDTHEEVEDFGVRYKNVQVIK